MFKKYRNKESGEECFIKMETETFLKVFFPDNIGEEGGDSEQTKIMNTTLPNRSPHRENTRNRAIRYSH